MGRTLLFVRRKSVCEKERQKGIDVRCVLDNFFLYKRNKMKMSRVAGLSFYRQFNDDKDVIVLVVFWILSLLPCSLIQVKGAELVRLFEIWGWNIYLEFLVFIELNISSLFGLAWWRAFAILGIFYVKRTKTNETALVEIHLFCCWKTMKLLNRGFTSHIFSAYKAIPVRI